MAAKEAVGFGEERTQALVEAVEKPVGIPAGQREFD